MIEREQIVIVLFRLLNFGVLIGLIFYGYKAYLLPEMKKKWEELKEMFAGMRRSHRHLQKEKRGVENFIVQDRQWQAALQEKVLRWQSLVGDRREQLLKERARRKRILDKQMEEQQNQVALYRAYKQVAPDALKEAREALKKKFDSGNAQQQFMNAVITALRK